MKTFAFLFVCFATAALWAQSAPQQPAPAQEPESDTVIARFEDGGELTYGQMKIFLGVLPPQTQQAAMRDRKTFVTQFALMRKLSQMAEKNKLYEKSPTREMLEFNRMQMLSGAQINEAINQVTVPPEEVQKYYETNRDRYTQVRVKAIYISFHNGAPVAGKKTLTEAEARAKAEKVLKEIRGGADFVKMVKMHSEDQTSAAKDGDFGSIRRSDSLPDAVRNAIFALKEGEVSEPVRQPNGFYLFRAEKLTPQPLAQVRDEIFNDLKQAGFRKWMEETQASLKITFVNEGVLAPRQPAAPAAPAAPAPAPKPSAPPALPQGK